jgi:hypothetical protein
LRNRITQNLFFENRCGQILSLSGAIATPKLSFSSTNVAIPFACGCGLYRFIKSVCSGFSDTIPTHFILTYSIRRPCNLSLASRKRQQREPPQHRCEPPSLDLPPDILARLSAIFRNPRGDGMHAKPGFEH